MTLIKRHGGGSTRANFQAMSPWSRGARAFDFEAIQLDSATRATTRRICENSQMCETNIFFGGSAKLKIAHGAPFRAPARKTCFWGVTSSQSACEINIAYLWALRSFRQ